MYQKMLWRKTSWLIIDKRKRKRHYILMNYFNRFMDDHSLHRGRKNFCYYRLHAFITEEIAILNCHKESAILKIALKYFNKVNMLN